MQMDVGLDTGDVLLSRNTPIKNNTTAAQLHDALAVIGAEAIVEALATLPALTAVSQPETGVTYAQKLSKPDAEIDWSLGAKQIHNKIRALNPVPGTWSRLNGQVIKIWTSSVLEMSSTATTGSIVAADKQGIAVQTGEGVVLITELQASGSKRMAAAAFVAGHADLLGQKFERQA